MKIPVCPVDNLVVTLEKRFQDEIITKGGLKLFLSTEFEPGENATVIGKVVSIPRGMSNDPEVKNLEPDVQVGDDLIFSYMVVCTMDQQFTYPVHEYEFEHEGQSYWKVPYSLVLGYIRDNVIYPATGYVFLDQRDPEQYEEKTSGGIWIPETAREKKTPVVYGTVKHIGKPYKNQSPLDVTEGDEVMFEKRFVERYKIQDKKWRVLKHDRVLGAVCI